MCCVGLDHNWLWHQKNGQRALPDQVVNDAAYSLSLVFYTSNLIIDFFYTGLTDGGEGETLTRLAKKSLFASGRGSSSLNVSGIVNEKGWSMTPWTWMSLLYLRTSLNSSSTQWSIYLYI